jgi:hypothetical protein
MLRSRLADALDFVSQLILLACLGILPDAGLDWLAARLPFKPQPPTPLLGEATSHCVNASVDAVVRDFQGE